MAYEIYEKQGENLVPIGLTTDERVSNLETKSIELDLNKLDIRPQELTPEQKQQVMANLADTWLSLGGGEMTGEQPIIFPSNFGNSVLRAKDTNGGIRIHGGTDTENGGGLFLYGKDASQATKGGFLIRASNDDGFIDLSGKTNGELQWKGLEIERVKQIANGDNGIIHSISFDSGLLICYADWQVNHWENGFTFSFPTPFLNTPAFVPFNNYGTPILSELTNTYFKIKDWATNSPTKGGSFVAIGRWK